jgi:hypothetical protein
MSGTWSQSITTDGAASRTDAAQAASAIGRLAVAPHVLGAVKGGVGGGDQVTRFDGVTFGVSDEEVVITDHACVHHARQAAQFSLERNSSDAATFQNTILRIPS